MKKTLELESKYVLFEVDETSGKKKIIAAADDGDESDNFFSLYDEETELSTLYIPREDGEITIIEDVSSFDTDYEENGFILFEKSSGVDDEDNSTFAYIFNENKLIELGYEKENLYINDQGNSKFVTFISDDYELVHFSFLSYFECDDVYFFEVAPSKFRIFSDSEEITEEEYFSVYDGSEDKTIFFWRVNLYQEVARVKSEIQFHNAYIIKNSFSNVYELYGFKNGQPILLGSGKDFAEEGYNVRIGQLVWTTDGDSWLLKYTPKRIEKPRERVLPQEEEVVKEYGFEEDDTSSQPTSRESSKFDNQRRSTSAKDPWWKKIFK